MVIYQCLELAVFCRNPKQFITFKSIEYNYTELNCWFSTGKKQGPEVKKISNQMSHRISIENINELKSLAQQNDPSFILKFHEYFHFFVAGLDELASTTLNAAEMEICAYTKLQFSTKDIALYLKCSVRSVENRKYRIRKKLGLASDIDFILWISRFPVDTKARQ